MKRYIPCILAIECLAIALAFFAHSYGLHTDEAKYLLSIPYPHPPLMRGVFSLIDGWRCQEIFIRIVVSTLLLQSSWFFWNSAKTLGVAKRICVLLVWLTSSAVLLQAGTIMLAVLTAIQAVVLVWMYERRPNVSLGAMGLLWIIMLFTAYQAVLFTPIVFAYLFQKNKSFKDVCLYGMIPILLLGLYTLTNPLVLQSFLLHSRSQSVVEMSMQFLRVILIGAGVVGLAALYAAIVKRQYVYGLVFLMLCLYCLLKSYSYYAILFTPIVVILFSKYIQILSMKKVVALTIVSVCSSVATILFVGYLPDSTTAQKTASLISMSQNDVVLMYGNFGHQWQYVLGGHIRKYHPDLLDIANTILCFQPCQEIADSAFSHRSIGDIDVYTKL